MTRGGVLAEARRVWPAAKAAWSPWLQLGAPEHAPGPIASLHLGSRRVQLDADRVASASLQGCLEALLAHEVGHHVAWPGTLATLARLRLIERGVVGEGPSRVNLFTDLLINERLGDRYAGPLAAIYRALVPRGAILQDPVLGVVLGTYEAWWGLAPGALWGDDAEAFLAAHPSARARAARLASQLVAVGPEVCTQLLLFLSVVRPLLRADPPSWTGCAHGDPTADDLAEALSPSAREEAALERAVAEGWIETADAARVRSFGGRVRAAGDLGGDGAPVPAVVAAWYRREAGRWLIRPPPARAAGEPVVPTGLSPWEPGEPLSAIDWAASVRAGGRSLARLAPLVRERAPEEGAPELPSGRAKLELYLDVSASMPDPRLERNPVTLAAVVLALGAVRAGGEVRAARFATRTDTAWSWSRSEGSLAAFLTGWSGGGTRFPFALLRESAAERGTQPARVVLSDDDLADALARTPGAEEVLVGAARRGPLVLVLHRPSEGAIARFTSLGARVVAVPEHARFPAVAASLSRALAEVTRA